MTISKLLLSGWLLAGTLTQAGETRLLDDAALDAIRNRAAHQHPTTIAARYRESAANQDVRAIRLWDDPMVGLGFMAARRPQMRREEGDFQIGVEIPIPKPGLYEANLLKTGALRRAESEKIRAAMIESGIEATMLAIELALADEIVRLSSGELAWLSEMETNAGQMALLPGSTGIDSIRLASEKVKLEQDVAASRRTRDGLARRLNVVMGKTISETWPTYRLPASAPPVPLAAAEVARIPFANPRVRAMREMAGAADAEIRIADRERLPSFSAGIETRGYSQDGYRGTTLGLKMTVPWFNRDNYQAKVDAAKLRSDAAVADTEAARREVAGQVISAATEAANAAAQARAYGGEIRKKATEANESVQASWINSKAPLTDLLDTRRLLFSVDLEQRRQVAMQLAATEKLNLLVPKRSSK
jgi:outer membrane protein, heavy metal efflux system